MGVKVWNKGGTYKLYKPMNNTITPSTVPHLQFQYHWCFVRVVEFPREEGFPAPALGDGSASSSTPGEISRWLYFLYSFFWQPIECLESRTIQVFFWGESTKYCFQNSKFELFLCEIDWRSGASSIQGTWPCWGNGGADVAGETAVPRTTPSTRLGN